MQKSGIQLTDLGRLWQSGLNQPVGYGFLGKKLTIREVTMQICRMIIILLFSVFLISCTVGIVEGGPTTTSGETQNKGQSEDEAPPVQQLTPVILSNLSKWLETGEPIPLWSEIKPRLKIFRRNPSPLEATYMIYDCDDPQKPSVLIKLQYELYEAHSKGNTIKIYDSLQKSNVCFVKQNYPNGDRPNTYISNEDNYKDCRSALSKALSLKKKGGYECKISRVTAIFVTDGIIDVLKE